MEILSLGTQDQTEIHRREKAAQYDFDRGDGNVSEPSIIFFGGKGGTARQPAPPRMRTGVHPRIANSRRGDDPVILSHDAMGCRSSRNREKQVRISG